MSTPMFIREPSAFRATPPGGSLVGAPGPWAVLVPITAEATLIEEVRFAAEEFSSDAGLAVLGIDNGIGVPTVVDVVPIPAGAADKWAMVKAPTNVCVPAGFRLVCGHNVQHAGAGGYLLLHCVALGGIVR